ncbi:Uncharacterized conserved protein (DUF2267) [Micromonospora carbonacea]|uniref:Uncharacterized conserved protein (DUF2267) n=1 Tax=Micromonospora carbonacea TaxID=47853 RepID=A0A1C4VRN0_9ACTN|nr:Uncharacterized conserved protein (DUF2267) [Micromonospora carbonacea]
MRKQMEGDNQRRRALARQARERGRQASETGASLSASKQLTHLDQGKRAGPAPAGRHKPDSTRGGPAPPPAAPPSTAPPSTARSRPARSRATGGPGETPATAGIGYRDLVDDVGRRAGVDFDTAKVAAEATVLALAWALDQGARERLLQAVPVKLHDVVPIDGIERHRDLPGFVGEVARISGRTPEQARRQAEATLGALADRDGDLVAALHVPDGLRDLLGPAAGG